MRDEDSTTYTGAIETAEEFVRRIYHRSVEAGLEPGAKESSHGRWRRMDLELGAKNSFRAPSRSSISITLASICGIWRAKLHPQRRGVQTERWMKVHQKRLLDNGKIEKLVVALRAHRPRTDMKWRRRFDTEADYFESNAERMRYPKFRRQHLFVGSGVIEAGCKTVIGSRLKRSGMFWTVRGANAVIALRCCRHSRQFEDYWESRRA